MYLLCYLFNMSLSTCEIPETWKCSRVIPLHKGGDPLEMNNYRPISIICSIAKIFEKRIYNQLSHYLNTYNILSPSQSGFRSNHSTTTALLKVQMTFSLHLITITLQVQFSLILQRHDLVDHYLLLDKLYSVGLSRNTLLWFNAYLHNRKQCVVLQGNNSDTLIQQRGVPQGSTLGPLLFSIFINDLPKICSECFVQLYADDTVLYTSQTNLLHIETVLQNDFNALQNWLLASRLLRSKTKSQFMIFGTPRILKSKSRNHSCVITCVDGTALQKVEHTKYLGLWLDSELSFKCHIDHVVKKINFGICNLYRSRNCFSFSVKKKLALQFI